MLLQAGAALEMHSTVIRVPVGLKALNMACAVGNKQNACWKAHAAPAAAAHEAVVVCSFRLAGQTERADSLHLACMEFKPLVKASGRTAHSADVPALDSKLPDLVYALRHEACSSTPSQQPATNDQPRFSSLQWQLMARVSVRFHAASGSAACSTLHQSIQLLQSAGLDRQNSATLLNTRLLANGVRTISLAHAAAAAMMKVAAAESYGKHYAHFAHDSIEAVSPVTSSDTSDIFGVNLTGKS